MTPSTCIAITIDQAYVLPAAVMLNSIVTSLGPDDEFEDPHIKIYVIGFELPRPAVASLGAICAQDRRITFAHLEVDPATIKGLSVLPLPARFPSATYVRLLLPRILEESMILYLDADLVVLTDIRRLLHTPVPAGTALLAATDLIQPVMPRRLVGVAPGGGPPEGSPYLNTGVQLIDAEAWRGVAAGRRALELARARPELIQLAEQDALNVVMAGSWAPLDRRWNAFPVRELLILQGLGEDDAEAVSRERFPGLEDDAWILHFLTAGKPWFPGFPPVGTSDGSTTNSTGCARSSPRPSDRGRAQGRERARIMTNRGAAMKPTPATGSSRMATVRKPGDWTIVEKKNRPTANSTSSTGVITIESDGRRGGGSPKGSSSSSSGS